VIQDLEECARDVAAGLVDAVEHWFCRLRIAEKCGAFAPRRRSNCPRRPRPMK
jgi:hypothetical protein